MLRQPDASGLNTDDGEKSPLHSKPDKRARKRRKLVEFDPFGGDEFRIGEVKTSFSRSNRNHLDAYWLKLGYPN